MSNMNEALSVYSFNYLEKHDLTSGEGKNSEYKVIKVVTFLFLY